MTSTGEVRVSGRGQMSLPASTRHRWGLDGGGGITFIDVGDVVLLLPSGIDELRRKLLSSVTTHDWDDARRGFGDPDLASE